MRPYTRGLQTFITLTCTKSKTLHNLSLAAPSRDAVSPEPARAQPAPARRDPRPCPRSRGARQRCPQGVPAAVAARAPGMPQLAPQPRGGLPSIGHPGDADWGLSAGFGSGDALQPPPPTGRGQPRSPGKRSRWPPPGTGWPPRWQRGAAPSPRAGRGVLVSPLREWAPCGFPSRLLNLKNSSENPTCFSEDS